jgi:AAA domain
MTQLQAGWCTQIPCGVEETQILHRIGGGQGSDKPAEAPTLGRGFQEEESDAAEASSCIPRAENNRRPGGCDPRFRGAERIRMSDHIPESPFPEPEEPREPFTSPFGADESEDGGFDPDQPEGSDDEDTAASDDQPGSLSMSKAEWARFFRDQGLPYDPDDLRPAWSMDIRTFAEWLNDPPEEECNRIEDLTLCGGNTLIYGLYKSGKTTLAINLARSLIDAVPLLDTYEIEPLDGVVVYLNYELRASQFHEWCAALGIEDTKRFLPINLRGAGAYLTDDDMLVYLIDVLKRAGAQALIVDNLLASLEPGQDPNQHAVASGMTHRLEALKEASGVTDLYLLAHTGHPTKFDRGGIPLNQHAAHSSWFMGWPDDYLSWLVDSKGTRYLATEDGRVSSKKDPMRVTFDPDTRHLRLDGDSTERAALTEEQVMAEQQMRDRLAIFLLNYPGSSANAIRDGVKGGHELKKRVLAAMLGEGQVLVEDGPRNALLYSLNPDWSRGR